MTPEERAEVAPSADNFSKVFGDRTEDSMSVTAADTAVSLATPVDSVVEVQKELQKEDPDYLKIGMLAGVEALGSIPALGPVAKSMIRKGADLAKQTDTAIDNGVGKVVSSKNKEPFKKTRSAYRIATQSEDGKLYPLFVNASDEIPVGEWVSASIPPVTFKGANGNMYVPSKGAARSKGEKAKPTGDMQTIPDQETADILRDKGFPVEKPSKSAPYGKVRAVASRPGFHATTKPVAHHLGPEDLIISSSERNKLLKAGITPKAFKAKTFNYLDGKLISKKKVSELSPEDKKRVKSQKKYYVKRRAEDQVFVEVEMADDTSEDLLKYMQERNRTDINDKLPSGGSYTYQDGQADAETWVVGGDMKVNRVLSREEAKAAQEAAGVKDLPYRSEIEEILGRKFSKGGLVGEEDMYTGQQDSILATGMADDLMQREEEQTQMAFALGGSVEEVDPVSGNEVPTGSLPEEVRDDIDAKLSEGEYVVPADVVRYYGVKFFEDLRSQAKMGFEDMAANGRIGGEPVPAEGGLPFDVSELQAEDVPDGPMMMNEGGDVTSMIQPDFMQGYTLPSAGQTQEYKTFVNDQGLTMTIRFVNGQPTVAVPAGYTEVGKEQPTATTPTSDRDRKSDRPIEVSKRDIPDYSSIPEGKKEADSWFSSVQKEIMGAKSLAGASVPVIGLAQIAHRKDIGKKLNALLKREDITEVNKTKVQSLLDQLNGENEPDFLGGLTNMADSIKSGVSTAADNFRNRAGMFYDPLEDISDTSLRDYGKVDKQGNRVLQTKEERQKDKDQSLSNAMVRGGTDAFHKQASENYRKDMEAAGYKSTPTGFVKKDNSDQRDAQDNNPNSGSRSYSGKSDGKGGYTF